MPMVTSGERDRGRANIGAGERIIMGLHEIRCVKVLKIVKYYRI